MGWVGQAEGEVMYTVVRFLAPTGRLSSVDEVGNLMNQIKPGTYSGLRRAGDGFACDVAKDGDWAAHARAIEEFLDSFPLVFGKARELGVAVTFDVAVEPEDIHFSGVSVFRLPADLLARVAAARASMELSVYR